MKTIKRILSVLLFLFSVIILFGCEFNATTKKNKTVNPKTESTTTTSTVQTIVEEKLFREGYTPESFTYVSLNEEKITEGLMLYTHTILNKSNNYTIVIRELEVDLNKVNVVAGTKNNDSCNFNFSKTTPHNAGLAYTSATGKKVFATLNADFFGSTCVNAFVKDGYIVKASHNDNGNYDYKNTNSDVPASAPMLFGIKGNTAQVAPIINYTGTVTDASVKKTLVQASLGYEVKAGIKTYTTSNTFKITKDSFNVVDGDMYAVLDLSNGVNDVTVADLYLSRASKTVDAISGNQEIGRAHV